MTSRHTSTRIIWFALSVFSSSAMLSAKDSPAPAANACEIDASQKGPGNKQAAVNTAGTQPLKKVKLNTPECYAHQLAILSSNYLTALEAQVTAQQTTYGALATVFASVGRQDTDLASDTVRDNQVQLWINHLADGSTTPNLILEDVARLATAEFSTVRTEEEQALDATTAYLATLNSLEVDTKDAANLTSLLNNLAQAADLKTTLSDLATYGQNVQSQLQQADCALAKSRLPFFQAESIQLAANLAKAGLSPSQKDLYTKQKSGVDQQVTSLNKKANACSTTAPSR